MPPDHSIRHIEVLGLEKYTKKIHLGGGGGGGSKLHSFTLFKFQTSLIPRGVAPHPWERG